MLNVTQMISLHCHWPKRFRALLRNGFAKQPSSWRVVLNLYARKGDTVFDASPVIDVDGTLLGVTKMMHITQYEGFYEQDYYTAAGTQAPVYDTAAGRIGVDICYDRHYSEYLRALALQIWSWCTRPAHSMNGPRDSLKPNSESEHSRMDTIWHWQIVRGRKMC